MKNWSLPKLLLVSIGAAMAALLTFVLVANFSFSNNGSDVEPSAQPSPTLTREGDTGKIKVVTSTRVWAEVTELLAGEWVEVVTLVPNGQDPHSYQASARDQLAVSEADLVIANGGGYDDFMDQLVLAAGVDQVFLKLVEGEHLHIGEGSHDEDENHEHGVENEHIWYDFELTLVAAELIVEAIAELRPEAFESVTAGFDFFTSEMENLEIRLEALRERGLGRGFIAPESVANLLLAGAGFENMTPTGLAKAIEEDREVSLADLTQAESLLSNKVAELLIINISSTPDSVTDRLIAAAEAGDRKIIRVSETGFLDRGDGSPIEELSYLDWMAWVIDQLQEAIY